MIWHIYTVTNATNGKKYVGIAINLKRRWAHHKKADSGSVALCNAIKKHGIEAFSFDHVASSFDQAGAHEIEKQLIKELGARSPNGYNLTDGGEGATGFKQSPETIAKKPRGWKHTPEHRAKMSALFKGRKTPWMYKVHAKIRGRKVSQEVKDRLASYRHLAYTPEALAKKSASLKGRAVPWVWKVAEKNRGRKLSAETRAKLSIAGLGRKQSQEWVAKRMAARHATLLSQGRTA